MLVAPYGLGLGKAGTDPQTPSIASVTVFKTDTAADWSSQTVVGLTPATGNLLVVLACRSNAASPNDINSVTWAGASVTEIIEAKHSATGGAHVWAGYINGGVSELGDLVVTADAGGAKHRDLIGWLVAVNNFAASPVGATYSYANRAVQAAQPVTLNVTNARSRLVGFAAAMNEDLHPMTLTGTGWTLQGTDRTGAGNSTTADIAAMIATKAATATGNDTMTATGAGTASTDDWCAVGIELLPY